MTKAELKLWAAHIKDNVPYEEYKEEVRIAVVDMARKTMKSFTDKDREEFLKESR